MTDNLPLYEQYRIASIDWVDKEAAASILEDLKSNFLSGMMGRLLEDGKRAINSAEREVKASQEWMDYVMSAVEARKVANLAKVKVDYIKMRHQEWLSQEANQRTEARL